MNAENKRKQITFFYNYYEAARGLPDRQRLALYDAILKYSFDDEEPKLTGLARTHFILIKPYIDKSKRQSGNASSPRKKEKTNSEPKLSQTDSQNLTTRQPNANQNVANSEPNDEPNANNKNKNKNKNNSTPPYPPRGGGEGGELVKTPFDIFWEHYPRKVGKMAAKKSYERINPGADLRAKILSTVAREKQSEQWRRDNGQFIPHPVTWLNQGRWDDEPTTPEEDPRGKHGKPNIEDKERMRRLTESIKSQ